MDQILSVLFLVLSLGGGVYALYTAIKLKKVGYLFESKFLYPSNCPMSLCVDVDGFIRHIFPCMLVLGIVDTLVGVVFSLSEFLKVFTLPDWAGIYLLPIIAVAPYVWVVIVQSKAAKLYW